MRIDLPVITNEQIAYELDVWEESQRRRPEEEAKGKRPRTGWTIIGWRPLMESETPSERFRDAWTLPNGIDGPIVVDIAKARQIRLAELRYQKVHEQALQRLNDKIEDAEDNDDPPAKIKALRAKRKALKKLDLAAKLQQVPTVEALDAFVPVELLE
jgi:hypothetical protein